MARKPIIFISYAHRDEPDDRTLWRTYRGRLPAGGVSE